MLDFGLGELIVLAAIALIALGPKRLPEVARLAGRFINDMRRIAGEVTGVDCQRARRHRQLVVRVAAEVASGQK